jgi:hypothetical protein
MTLEIDTLRRGAAACAARPLHLRFVTISHAGGRERTALQTRALTGRSPETWGQYSIAIAQADQCRASQCGICRGGPARVAPLSCCTDSYMTSPASWQLPHN